MRDGNAFLFGNLIPDIYVGYMVPGVVRPVPYRVTHFAKPEHIPKPRAGEFFDAYVHLIPDIYVGYMVPGVVRPVPYRVTHFAKPEHIPKPRAGEFFDAYVLPLARECGLLDTLGDDCATGGGVGAPGFASG